METFTLVTCFTHGHSTETFYGSREEAETRFDALCVQPDVYKPTLCGVFLYGAEVGGLINSWRN